MASTECKSICIDCPRQDTKMWVESASESSDPFVQKGYELALSILDGTECKGPETDEGLPFVDCGKDTVRRAAQSIMFAVYSLERIRP